MDFSKIMTALKINGASSEREKTDSERSRSPVNGGFYKAAGEKKGRLCQLPTLKLRKPSIVLIAMVFVSAALLLLSEVIELPDIAALIIRIIAALALGYDVIFRAVKDIINREYARENIPVLLAVIVSFSIGRVIEGVLALFLLQLGYFLRDLSLYLTRKSLLGMALAYDSDFHSASGNVATIEAGFGVCTAIEEKLSSKLQYLPLVMIVLGVISFLVLHFGIDYSAVESLWRVVVIIAIASPVSVLIGIPTMYFSGMTAAIKHGIIFKNAAVVEKTGIVKAVAIDKKGIITNENYIITDIVTDKMDEEMLLKVAAHAVAISDSPFAKSIVEAYGKPISDRLVESRRMRPDGISAQVDGIEILIGYFEFMAENGVLISKARPDEAAVYMAIGGIYAGTFIMGDDIIATVPQALKKLAKVGVSRISMLSDDKREMDRLTAAKLGINEHFAEMSQEEKIRRIKGIKVRISPNSTLAYVGAGSDIGDACAAADVGMAVCGIEGRGAPDSAKILIMRDPLDAAAIAISISSRVRRNIMYQVIAGLSIKLVIIVLAVLGIVPLWFGLTIDICMSLAIILHSFSASRLSKIKDFDLMSLLKDSN